MMYLRSAGRYTYSASSSVGCPALRSSSDQRVDALREEAAAGWKGVVRCSQPEAGAAARLWHAPRTALGSSSTGAFLLTPKRRA